MTYPFYPPLRTFFLHGTNTSSSGAEIKNIVPCRAKYVSTLFSVWGSTAGGTSGFDVFAYFDSLGHAATSSPTVTSITSVKAITTTTGNVTFEVGSTNAPQPIFNRGDLIGVTASTGVGNATGWSYVHTFQEF